MAHNSPRLGISVPDAVDSADVPTHLETIVTNMERHTVIWCLSSGRPTTPEVGLTIYETDTKKTMVYYGGTIGWKPPWGSAWGVLGTAEVDAPDITTIGNISSSSWTSFNSVTVGVVTNRLIEVNLTIASLATLGSAGAVYIQINAGTTGRMRGTPVSALVPAFLGPSPNVRGYEICPVTGTRAYQWWGRLASGGAANIAAPLLMTVKDVGPA